MQNDMSDRLVELIRQGKKEFTKSDITYIETYLADYLIANGVIVPPCKVGDEIWVVETEDGEAVDITCYMFLAKSKGCIIATSWINDYDLDETLEYHINETQDNQETDLVVYPEEYCFATEEQAKQKLKEMRGENE